MFHYNLEIIWNTEMLFVILFFFYIFFVTRHSAKQHQQEAISENDSKQYEHEFFIKAARWHEDQQLPFHAVRKMCHDTVDTFNN